MESAHFIKTGKLVSLSEQQFIDCDTSGDGCNHGDPAHAFEYAKANAIMTEADYPYKGETGEIFDGKCHYDQS